MVTARGNDAIIQERVKGAFAPLTTEKMLSANRKMSNIFLQRGQNIDIAHKKAVPAVSNFGSLRGLTVYLR
jgi:hypothetical protein